MAEPDDIVRPESEGDRPSATDAVGGSGGSAPPDTDVPTMQQKTLSESGDEWKDWSASQSKSVGVGSKLGPYLLGTVP